MINVNGKEYGLFYSVGARCKSENYIVNNPKASIVEFKIQQVIYMAEAYGQKNKVDQKLTQAMIYALPNMDLEEILEEAEKQIEADSTKTVESEPEKNGKSAGK